MSIKKILSEKKLINMIFKHINEAPIDYGDYPERMDPNIERSFANPENLLAKTLRGGSQQVEKLASARFKKIADKLRDLTGIGNLTANDTKALLQREMLNSLQTVIQIESENNNELTDLAVKYVADESQIDPSWVNVEAEITGDLIPMTNFRKSKEEEPQFKEDLTSFDVNDLTKQEQFELEKAKRNIINSIIHGSAKKSQFFFQRPEIKSELDNIDPRLYPAYMKLMALNDLQYFTESGSIEMAKRLGIAGSTMEIESHPDAPDDEPNVTIKVKGAIFPYLVHELFKGVEEVKAGAGLPEDPEIRSGVEGQVDTLDSETMQLQIGPEIVERLRYAMPAEIFENRGLINWFQMELYSLPAKQFLAVINDVISDEDVENRNGIKKLNDILKTAKQKKEEYEKSNPESVKDNDDEDFDSFLKDLGL